MFFFKVGFSIFKNIRYTFFHVKLLKMVENAFYFILKALFFYKIFRFLS